MSFYREFAQPAMLALARAGNRGCRVDTKLRAQLRAQAEISTDNTLGRIDKLVGRSVNPNSPKQVAELLYDDLKLPVQRKRGKGGQKGGVTTDEEAMKALRRLFPQHGELLSELLAFRGFSKEASRLGMELEEREGESYFVTSYNATGTVTGRISSSKPIVRKGGNLQNQTRGPSRRIFVAREGMRFVKADGSQAEARVTAALCRDEELLRCFEDPLFDIHVESARMLYGGGREELLEEDREREEGRKKDSRRQKSKAITHGAAYLGGPRVAVKTADVPYAEAKRGIERYRRGRPLLQEWWDRVECTLKSTRRITTCWGRTRLFLKRADQSALREAVAHEPQSTVGDLINRAFFRLDDRLEALGAWPLLQSHDEIVCEARVGTEEEVAEVMKEEFEQKLTLGGFEVVIPADVAIGDNWYDLEKWKG